MNKAARKNIVSAIITALILAVAGLISQQMASQKKSTVSDKVVKKDRRRVEVSSFAPSTEPNTIAIDGRLRAHDRVSLTSEVQGVMLPGSGALRAGKYVKQGDLLFAIDDREAAYSLKAQKSSLMTSITQMMPDLKFDYPDSFDSWLQYLNSMDVDKPLTKLPTPLTDQEKFFVSGRNIYNQFYTIKSLETRLADYRIYAPFSGVITAVSVVPGALISPGQSLATMINTATYEIEAPVPMATLRSVKVGQSVELSSGDLDQKWTGRVSRVGTIIDPSTQYIPLYISVGGRGLKDGMYLTGELSSGSLQGVTKLPKSVFLSPTSVYVVQDSTLVAREVTSVKRTADHVVVSGLAADAKVVTGSLAGLFEGQKVTY